MYLDPSGFYPALLCKSPSTTLVVGIAAAVAKGVNTGVNTLAQLTADSFRLSMLFDIYPNLY